MIIRTLPQTSRTRYLTGMTAVNIPSPEGSGDWHFHDAFFGYADFPQRYFVAGVDLMDTSPIFADAGVFDCKPIMSIRRVCVSKPSL